MAAPLAVVMEAWGKVTGFLDSQVNDGENWAFNTKMAKAVGLFAGSIFLMRNCGHVMDI